MKKIATSPLELTLISDTHYFSKRNGCSGPAYERENQKSQKLLKDSEEVLRAAFRQIAGDKRTDIVLLSGDVVNNGELSSHEEMIPLLRELKAAGKRVFVITASHDYDKGRGFDGDKVIEVPYARRGDLREMYWEFGPAQALAYHEESCSYTAQLAEGYRLLAIYDNDNDDDGFKENLADWIKEQVHKAHEEGQFILSMAHHPVIAPSPFYAIIGKGDMMHGSKKIIKFLTKLDVSFIFTGHTHIQDISYRFDKKNRVFYDVSTPSLVGYPGSYRHIIADAQADTLTVSTEEITEPVAFECVGGTLKSHFENQFFGMIRDVIEAAANDVERFSYMANAFSIRPKLSLRFGWLIKPVAKWLNKLTIGRVAKWTRAETGLKPEDYAGIKDEKVVDFIVTLVMHLFGGDSPYGPDTAKFKIAVGLMNVLDSFLGIIGVAGKLPGGEGVRGLAEPLLFNRGIRDYEAVLPLHASPEEVEALCPAFNDTVKPSRKGLPVLLTLIALLLLLLPLLPLAALLIGIGFLINQIKYGERIKENKAW